jgi:hypothetical protein
VESEQQQHTMLRLCVEPGSPSRELPLRQGRAIAWFEGALEFLRPEPADAAELMRDAGRGA